MRQTRYLYLQMFHTDTVSQPVVFLSFVMTVLSRSKKESLMVLHLEESFGDDLCLLGYSVRTNDHMYSRRREESVHSVVVQVPTTRGL